MSATDPRKQFDDPLVERNEHAVDEERFTGIAAYEAYVAGWVTTAVVPDDEGQILLAYDVAHDRWVAPGGTLQQGERLQESVGREVKEGTGVAVRLERPHGVIGRHSRRPAAGVNVVTVEVVPEDFRPEFILRVQVSTQGIYPKPRH